MRLLDLKISLYIRLHVCLSVCHKNAGSERGETRGRDQGPHILIYKDKVVSVCECFCLQLVPYVRPNNFTLSLCSSLIY